VSALQSYNNYFSIVMCLEIGKQTDTKQMYN
jgi:hypothetical protein